MGMAGVVSLLALLMPLVSAVTLNYTLGISTTSGFTDSVVLCNSSFDAANATGIFSFTPKFNPDARFGGALALSQGQKAGPGLGLQASLMFDPGTQDYYNNSKTGFDACTFAFNIVALTTNTWLRGQYDNGSCLQTFDSTCVDDLNSRAQTLATQINQPASEAAGALADVCQQLLVKISASVPESCKPYTESGISLLAGVVDLTQSAGLGSSAFNKSCTIRQNGTTWYNLNTQVASYSDAAYDIAANFVWPVMTIFMPPADSKVTSKISSPESVLSCLHINHFNNGSRVALSAGTPTPVITNSNSTSSSSATSTPISAGISAGAVAGIVIVVIVLAVAGLGTWFFMRRRRRTRHHQPLHERGVVEIYSEEPKRDRKYSELGGHALTELSPDSHKSELPAPFSAELAGNYHYEMDAGHQYHELPGTIPDAKISDEGHDITAGIEHTAEHIRPPQSTSSGEMKLSCSARRQDGLDAAGERICPVTGS